jgi:hypothetical protein
MARAFYQFDCQLTPRARLRTCQPSSVVYALCCALAGTAAHAPRCGYRPVISPLSLPHWQATNKFGALSQGVLGRATGLVYDASRNAVLATNSRRGAAAGAPVLVLRESDAAHPAREAAGTGGWAVTGLVESTSDALGTAAEAVAKLLPSPFGLAVDTATLNVYVTNAQHPGGANAPPLVKVDRAGVGSVVSGKYGTSATARPRPRLHCS